MYCWDLESLNWLAQCTWLMAADQYLIVLAILASAASEAKRTLCRRPAVHVDCRAVCHGLSTLIGAVRPLLPVLRWAGVERRQLYLAVRHDLADNSFREVGSRRWTVRIISGNPFCTRTFRPSPVCGGWFFSVLQVP